MRRGCNRVRYFPQTRSRQRGVASTFPNPLEYLQSNSVEHCEIQQASLPEVSYLRNKGGGTLDNVPVQEIKELQGAKIRHKVQQERHVPERHGVPKRDFEKVLAVQVSQEILPQSFEQPLKGAVLFPLGIFFQNANVLEHLSLSNPSKASNTGAHQLQGKPSVLLRSTVDQIVILSARHEGQQEGTIVARFRAPDSTSRTGDIASLGVHPYRPSGGRLDQNGNLVSDSGVLKGIDDLADVPTKKPLEVLRRPSPG
mmetsp:Transcript_6693/g.24127  ORF Transcript_6693/g.24127 Transcript_6693/m.24127 type:complete len:255 (-) Transcript_6693:1375-2139(-)